MKQHPVLLCPKCGEEFTISISDLKMAISRFKIRKAEDVVDQLKKKSGPFYEKWKAAMVKRGKPRRCGECKYIFYPTSMPVSYACSDRWRPVRPQNFACRHFQELSRSPS